MKANELRIGNLIYQSLFGVDVTTEVKGIDHGTVYFDDRHEEKFRNKVDLENAEPITLTEEWLIEFGWIWNKETNSYENKDARMHLSKRAHGYVMFNYVLKAMICDKIFYVHQLQNLFWCLTGEELTVKQAQQPS
jgi:hypothetical protein